jgi:hypothetical protein
MAACCRLNLGSHLSNRSPSNSGKVADDLPMIWNSIVRPAMRDLGCGGWDSNPRIPKEQGYRKTCSLLLPVLSKLRTFSSTV